MSPHPERGMRSPPDPGDRIREAADLELRVTIVRGGSFEAHARIPIAFVVDRALRPAPEPSPGSGGTPALEERPVVPPYRKDYDVPGHRPTDWPGRFDTEGWVTFTGWQGAGPAGGIVVVGRCPGIDMLEGRSDLAVLWDVRVHPALRGRGVGSRLVAEVVAWARRTGYRTLKVETQNVNVPACRFYERCGFELRTVHEGAYPELPDEIALLWYRELGPVDGSPA